LTIRAVPLYWRHATLFDTLNVENDMPIKENAKKAFRQSIKRTVRNRGVKDEIKSLRVKFRKLVTSKEVAKAEELVRQLGKKLDKSVTKGVMKKNTVARLKSRAMAKLNALKKA